ncbi:hypothetical protein TrLO_g11130 [Triparma laevis f. longispina]|uniref:RRM domain-containing protein n=1 Tax=Triparma laevis f. longispina TaxID=1714387 RepID=A0A9W7C2S5_9STRA|nr:hypothetical protein TrLO_g11130 [Triparma laevis f. longispina]
MASTAPPLATNKSRSEPNPNGSGLPPDSAPPREQDVTNLEQAADSMKISNAQPNPASNGYYQDSQKPGQTSNDLQHQQHGYHDYQQPPMPPFQHHNIVVPQSYDPFDLSAISSKLFVGGLDAKVSQADFYMYFIQFGEIIDSVVMFDKETQRSRGFGFVTFAKKEDAEKVMAFQEDKTEEARKAAKLENPNDHDANNVRDGHLILNKLVEIKRAEPKNLNSMNGKSPQFAARGGNKKLYGHHRPQNPRSRGRGTAGAIPSGGPGNYHAQYGTLQLRHPQQASTYAQQVQQQVQQQPPQQQQPGVVPANAQQPGVGVVPPNAQQNNANINYNPNHVYSNAGYQNQYSEAAAAQLQAQGNMRQYPMYYDPYAGAGAYGGASYPVYGENGEVFFMPYDPNVSVVMPQAPHNGAIPQRINGENGEAMNQQVPANQNNEKTEEGGGARPEGESSSVETEVNE